MMGKKRTDKIVAVTVAKYATMFIEADNPDEAMKYAKEYCDEVDDSEFWDSDVQVDSWENYTTESDEDMEKIWIEDGKTMTIEEYWDALDKQEEIDEMQLKLFQ